MLKRLEDFLLARLQRRCTHPRDLVAADCLEATVPGLQVRWCRRCGAIRPQWDEANRYQAYYGQGVSWRTPDPHLWRG